MIRRRLVGAGALLLLLVLPALLAPCGKEAANPDRIRLNLLKMVSFGPLHIARAEGYFADEGLEVEEVRLTRSAYGLASLAQGDLDVVAGSVSAGILNAIARGAPIRIVADKGHIGTGPECANALLVRRELSEQGYLDDPGRLRGLRLITNRDNTAGYFVDQALARVGLCLADMDQRYVENPLRPEAMKAGQTDLLTVQEPWLAQTLATGEAVVWMRDYEVVPGMQHAVIVFGPTLLHERPEAGQRFLRAYLRGVRRYNEGRTERNLEVLARATGLEVEEVRASFWPEVRDDGRINVEGLLAFQAWAKKQGLVDRELSAEELWDPRFVDAAATEGPR